MLRRRIDEAARYLPIENIAIGPQCGFASSEYGNPLSGTISAANSSWWSSPPEKSGARAAVAVNLPERPLPDRIPRDD